MRATWPFSRAIGTPRAWLIRAEPTTYFMSQNFADKHLTIANKISLEQDCRNDPGNQGLLLSLFEGKTIDFDIHETMLPHTKRREYAPHSEGL